MHLGILVCNQNIGYWHLTHLAAAVVCKALLSVLVLEGLVLDVMYFPIIRPPLLQCVYASKSM